MLIRKILPLFVCLVSLSIFDVANGACAPSPVGSASSGLSSIALGPHVIVNDPNSDLAIHDCLDDHIYEVAILHSQAPDPVSFHFSDPCGLSGISSVEFRFQDHGAGSEWSAYDGQGALLDQDTVAAGFHQSVTLSSMTVVIDHVTVECTDICVEHICWHCHPHLVVPSDEITLDSTDNTPQWVPIDTNAESDPEREVTWKAETDVEWISFDPRSGFAAMIMTMAASISPIRSAR
jgi:hypothetical protein